MQTTLWFLIGLLIGSSENQEPVKQEPIFTQENKDAAINMLLDNQFMILGSIMLFCALPIMFSAMKAILGGTR